MPSQHPYEPINSERHAPPEPNASSASPLPVGSVGRPGRPMRLVPLEGDDEQESTEDQRDREWMAQPDR